MKKFGLTCGILSLLAPTLVSAEEGQLLREKKQRIYSPYVERTANNSNFAEGVFWGDTHLHTKMSSDSGMVGNKLGPEEAYRFAKGEEVLTSSGQRARLIRPVDFLLLSDHAENLGLAPFLEEANPDLLATENGKRWYDMEQAGQRYDVFLEWAANLFTGDVIKSKAMQRTAWDRQIEAADKHNEPGVFTALIGFEWSSMNVAETPSNLHRVVVFKDDGDKAGKVLPFSAYDSHDPEDLWTWMAGYEDKTGGRIMSIPHNGNLSNGLMFATERLKNGQQFDKNYAEQRIKWEPLYEVTQIKGDGETHPLLSPDDEFADYGTWDKGDILGNIAKEESMLAGEYARSALQIGLQQANKLGVNPFKFGMIGATDAHTGLVTTREENFWGKMPTAEPSEERLKLTLLEAFSGDETLNLYEYETLSSGLAAVWAKENTREEIFNAMAKKEVYGTTGTRIVVRFFGGWDYDSDDVYKPDVVTIGYDKGVPMGGDLAAIPKGKKAPTFMVGAAKDSWGANLDRIQIIKGWVDKEGGRQERVYDVAVSDNRKIGRNGRAKKPVGDTVDKTSYLNSIGDAELRVVWTDPDFDPSLRAVYYARVLEIPTPTWQAFDVAYFDTELPVGTPRKHQERAYTSPIWYTP